MSWSIFALQATSNGWIERCSASVFFGRHAFLEGAWYNVKLTVPPNIVCILGSWGESNVCSDGSLEKQQLGERKSVTMLDETGCCGETKGMMFDRKGERRWKAGIGGIHHKPRTSLLLLTLIHADITHSAELLKTFIPLSLH
jgi:hypothetical protein